MVAAFMVFVVSGVGGGDSLPLGGPGGRVLGPVTRSPFNGQLLPKGSLLLKQRHPWDQASKHTSP